MAIWFFLLGCGGLGFSVKILLEHYKQAGEIDDGIRATERACLEAEEATQVEEAESIEIKAELEQAKAELTDSQGKIGTLTTQITKRKEAMASRGKFRV